LIKKYNFIKYKIIHLNLRKNILIIYINDYKIINGSFVLT